MRDRQTCIECGKLSPETDTNYTLISSQFGWRLTRRRTTDSQFVIEWRCPDCWKNFKTKKDDKSPVSEQEANVAAGGFIGSASRGRNDPPKPSR